MPEVPCPRWCNQHYAIRNRQDRTCTGLFLLQARKRTYYITKPFLHKWRKTCPKSKSMKEEKGTSRNWTAALRRLLSHRALLSLKIFLRPGRPRSYHPQHLYTYDCFPLAASATRSYHRIVICMRNLDTEWSSRCCCRNQFVNVSSDGGARLGLEYLQYDNKVVITACITQCSGAEMN